MQRQIQEFIENTTTNPRFGTDPSQIDFPVFGHRTRQKISGVKFSNFVA